MDFQLFALFALAAAAALYLAANALGPLFRRSREGCSSGCGGCPSSRTCRSLGSGDDLQDAPRKP